MENNFNLIAICWCDSYKIFNIEDPCAYFERIDS